MSKRLGVFVTHPIQYFAPLWRELAKTPGVDLTVHFFSDHGVRASLDAGFGRAVAWDVPLLDGYDHAFLSRDADLARPGAVRLPQPRKTLADGRFDAVMIHGYTHAFERQVVRAAKARGLGTIIRGEFTDAAPFGGRSAAKTWLRDLYLRRFYRSIDAFCYIGREARDHLLRRGIPPQQLFFSPYSVDGGLSAGRAGNEERQAARAELGLSPDQTVLLFSGKLIPRKEPLLLIEAINKFARLNKLGQLDTAEKLALIVLGDGELREQVETAGRELLGPQLVMPGFVNQSQLAGYFLAADLFVLPSAFETWGLVVNEAMQFGLPAIVSDRVGCRHDLVEEGQTGHVFHSGDADSLAATLRSALAAPDALERMGQNARRRIARYSVQASAEGILAALEAIVPRRAKSSVGAGVGSIRQEVGAL